MKYRVLKYLRPHSVLVWVSEVIFHSQVPINHKLRLVCIKTVVIGLVIATLVWYFLVKRKGKSRSPEEGSEDDYVTESFVGEENQDQDDVIS